MEEKVLEIQDEMKRDRVDAISKLAILRSEVSDKTFDTDTFNFLKNQVRFEWPIQMTKVNENDVRLRDLITRHEEVNTLINRTIAKIKESEVVDLESAVSEDEVEQENDEGSDAGEAGLKDARPLDETEVNSKEGKTPRSQSKPLSATISNEESQDGRKKSAKRKTETLDSKLPGTQRSTILQNLPKKDKANLLQKVEELEKRVEKFELLEEQIEALGKLSHLKRKKKSAKGTPKNTKKLEKVTAPKDQLLKKGKILEIIAGRKLNYCDSPLSDSDVIFEGNPYFKPLEWNYDTKRWMGPDQITVETAFKLPNPIKRNAKSKDRDGSVDMNGQMRHQEHQEYRTYVDQYNKDKAEREFRERMIAQE